MLGGEPAGQVLDGADGGRSGYWPRVWAARGLLHAWDDHGRVARQPSRRGGRSRIIGATWATTPGGSARWRPRSSPGTASAERSTPSPALRDDPVPRVRAAAAARRRPAHRKPSLGERQPPPRAVQTPLRAVTRYVFGFVTVDGRADGHAVGRGHAADAVELGRRRPRERAAPVRDRPLKNSAATGSGMACTPPAPGRSHARHLGHGHDTTLGLAPGLGLGSIDSLRMPRPYPVVAARSAAGGNHRAPRGRKAPSNVAGKISPFAADDNSRKRGDGISATASARRRAHAAAASASYGVSRFGPRNRNIASRSESSPSSVISRRPRPRPNPPCGGHPYLKLFR